LPRHGAISWVHNKLGTLLITLSLSEVLYWLRESRQDSYNKNVRCFRGSSTEQITQAHSYVHHRHCSLWLGCHLLRLHKHEVLMSPTLEVVCLMVEFQPVGQSFFFLNRRIFATIFLPRTFLGFFVLSKPDSVHSPTIFSSQSSLRPAGT